MAGDPTLDGDGSCAAEDAGNRGCVLYFNQYHDWTCSRSLFHGSAVRYVWRNGHEYCGIPSDGNFHLTPDLWGYADFPDVGLAQLAKG